MTLADRYCSALRDHKFKRQSIMLTGFGVDKMETCIKGVQAIFRRFERMLPANTLEEWTPTLFNGYNAIDMGNRFFTGWHDQSNHEIVPFKPSVDPDGILEQAMGSDFVHLWERPLLANTSSYVGICLNVKASNCICLVRKSFIN